MNRAKLARHTRHAEVLQMRWMRWDPEQVSTGGSIINQAIREYTAKHVPETGVFATFIGRDEIFELPCGSEDMLETRTVPSHDVTEDR